VLILEYKIYPNVSQRQKINEAIRTVQFIRNKCLRLWMEQWGVSAFDLNVFCAEIARAFPFAARLNSMARQAAAERAWCAIARFYDNCQKKKPGKKGYPKFQKDNRSVEYKTSGWKLEPNGKHLTFTDGHGIGTLKLIGTRSIETFPLEQIKRVRLLQRANGYYVQFAVKAGRQVDHHPTDHAVGIDVGLKSFYTDSDGHTVANPRFYRKAEQKLKRLHRRVSRKKKGSKNRQKARKRLARGHQKVSRQRKDFACKQTSALVSSSDLIAYEHLHIRNMVKNRHLAKSIHDAAWGLFLSWVRYYGSIQQVPVIAVPAAYTSQDCSRCGYRVQKSLSVRTHVCPNCGLVMDRDHNSAVRIRDEGFRTWGHRETGQDAVLANASGQTTTTRRGKLRPRKSAG
jgi:putative transposase